MTEREKLCDLIDNARVRCETYNRSGMPRNMYEARMVAEDHIDCLVEYLLALGVQLPEWTPVTERLPIEEYNEYKERWQDDEDPAFLVMIEHAVLPNRLYFDGEHWYQEMHGCIYPYKVTHWMNMPEPPAKD